MHIQNKKEPSDVLIQFAIIDFFQQTYENVHIKKAENNVKKWLNKDWQSMRSQ
jgi:hypothetical protein